MKYKRVQHDQAKLSISIKNWRVRKENKLLLPSCFSK